MLLKIELVLLSQRNLRNLCCIYEISSPRVLRDWIKKYNGHKTIKSHNKQGDRITTNGRKTTYEERIEIVTFCILNNDEYIVFYNTKRLQKNLKGLTPIEYRNQTLAS